MLIFIGIFLINQGIFEFKRVFQRTEDLTFMLSFSMQFIKGLGINDNVPVDPVNDSNILWVLFYFLQVTVFFGIIMPFFYYFSRKIVNRSNGVDDPNDNTFFMRSIIKHYSDRQEILLHELRNNYKMIKFDEIEKTEPPAECSICLNEFKKD